MRLPRFRPSLRVMMATVAALGVGCWAFARYERSWTYYAAGWWEAERELWRGEASVYGFCGVSLGPLCRLDRETGLPEVCVAGCVIKEGDQERRDGHNDHVAQYIRWNGFPGNSFKPWENDLFDLKGAFARLARGGAPVRLTPGGPAAVSPDGKNRVQPVGRGHRDGLEVVISAGDVVLRTASVRFDKGDSDLVWGPNGSRFAVVRSTREGNEQYAAYDLRTGRILREERPSETWLLK